MLETIQIIVTIIVVFIDIQLIKEYKSIVNGLIKTI